MDLADLIEPGRVIFGVHANTKEKLLLDLASRAAASLNLDPKLVFNALQAREQLGSTGLGEGFALPHARIEGLDRFLGMFARLNRPIHFDSFLFQRPPKATTSPRLLPSPGTWETRNSPRDCAKLQTRPHCATSFVIPKIR